MLIGIAEIILVFFSVVIGITLHAMILNGLLLQYVARDVSDVPGVGTSPRHGSLICLLPLLAQLSLVRILSLVTPSRGIPELYWYALIGVPSMIGVVLAVRACGYRASDIGLTRQIDLAQVAIAMSGIPLGLAGYFVIRPEARARFDTWGEYLLGALFLLIFAGFLEELLFRGLLQQVADQIIGRFSILWSNALFALMYLGSESWTFVLFMTICGMIWGWWVHRTRVLWGVAIAHSITAIAMLIVFPATL